MYAAYGVQALIGFNIMIAMYLGGYDEGGLETPSLPCD